MSRSLHRVGVVSALSAMVLSAFMAPPAAAATAPSAARIQHGARPTRSVSSLQTSISNAAMPHLGFQTPAASPGDVLANFDGVSSRDSGVTNFGAEFEPPDQGLCTGNGFVLEMVNSAFRVFDTHGNTLAGPTNVNAPFHDGFKQFTSDPRCQFDAATNTWFAVVLFINNSSTGSRLDIAFNTTGDPTTIWSVFRIDTTDAGAPKSRGCPCFGDQPTLGIDASNIYTTTNEFSILGPQFNGAQIYAISKSDLVTHAANVHFVHYKNLSIGGALAASVQPALTDGPAPAEYFLSSLDPNGTGDKRLGVWALTNVSAVAAGGTPALSSLIITSESYAIPPPAKQMDSAKSLDSGDDRMQQTQVINGHIWGELDTSVLIAGDPKPRAGAAWFRVTPQLSGSSLAGAIVDGQGYVAVAGNYVLYPALQADVAGRAAMVFTISGAHRFASAAFATLASGGSSFGPPVVSAAGTGPYDHDATRWGDYSWAVLDPTADAVWMATEYMPPLSSQTADGNNNWGTRVVELSLHR